MDKKRNSGFTLIELSIVLVIIGLIVGGVLAGRDLIEAAEIRATISQIEKYNTAVNTFRVKYGYLPGDITAGEAAQLGLSSRTGNPGEGDGNGIIEGYYYFAWNGNYPGANEGSGELNQFWVDLTWANGRDVNLIEGNFTQYDNGGGDFFATNGGIDLWFPKAKIGNGNYIYVYSYGGTNYFGLSSVVGIYSTCVMNSLPGLSVSQAYAIDSKIDDGYPQTGRVTATYLNWDGYSLPSNTFPMYATGGNTVASAAASSYGPADRSATQGTSTSCFDNDDTAGNVQHYSTEIDSGNDENCALSFPFQ